MSPKGGKREGSGRPEKWGEPAKDIHIKLPQSLLDLVDAKRKEMSRSEYLVRLLKLHLT